MLHMGCRRDGKSRMLRLSIPAPRSANQQPGLWRRRNKDMRLYWPAMVVYIKCPLTFIPQLLICLKFLRLVMEQIMKISYGHIIAIYEIINGQASMVKVNTFNHLDLYVFVLHWNIIYWFWRTLISKIWQLYKYELSSGVWEIITEILGYSGRKIFLVQYFLHKM